MKIYEVIMVPLSATALADRLDAHIAENKGLTLHVGQNSNYHYIADNEFFDAKMCLCASCVNQVDKILVENGLEPTDTPNMCLTCWSLDTCPRVQDHRNKCANAE